MLLVGGKNPEGAHPLTSRQTEGSSWLARSNPGNAEPGDAPCAADKPSKGDGSQGTLLVEGRHGDIRGSCVFLSP